ncbi:hypothetical protein [Rhodovulum sp. FJ3]|uniref:DUF3885 domain-containing protein n=1 Tax=Rhodovulum sp. FJ3 TaxID=3079053 RepID=UPI00293DE783|nr:hypothetical protein [Rhodovulum sp. FJ3]MDV4166886.1 hypothetical protein [Rhodovulum sp. FJ3]
MSNVLSHSARSSAWPTLPPFVGMVYSNCMPESESKVEQNEFSKAWRRSFGMSPPLGYVLRYDYFQNWTRFHSLPNSKRLAKSDEEFGILLERANTLAAECFEKQTPIWIATGRLSEIALNDDDLPIRMNMSKVMDWIDEDEAPAYQQEWSFFASRAEWTRSSLDWLFREIAEDRERAVLFSEDAQTVFAPYDGGFDIISLQPGKITQLENTYSSWMSSRPDQL